MNDVWKRLVFIDELARRIGEAIDGTVEPSHEVKFYFESVGIKFTFAEDTVVSPYWSDIQMLKEITGAEDIKFSMDNDGDIVWIEALYPKPEEGDADE